MDDAQVVDPRFCNAKTKRGTPCKRAAGAGTDHPGVGPCRRHLGNTRNHVRAGNRALALEQARKMLGQDVEGDPTDVILEGVRLARGLTLYYRAVINAHDGEVPENVERLYAEAVERQTDMAYKAARAGVAERMVRLAERAADAITLTIEEVASGLEQRKGFQLTAEDRVWMAQTVQTALSRHEQPVIEGGEAA